MPSEGSRPLEMAPSDWTIVAKSAGWTLLATVIGAALTALADTLITSTLPMLKDNGVIDVVLFGLLTTLVDALRKALQQWLSDTRISRLYGLLLAALLLVPGGRAMAEEVGVVVDDAKPGTFLVTVGADRAVSVIPFRIVRPGVNPSPPPNVPPPGPPVGPPPGNNPSLFELEVEAQAKAAIALGGSLTTGAAFSEVYGLVSAGVANGTIDHNRCLEAVNLGTAHILSRSADAKQWSTFELLTRNSLQIFDGQGKLQTKEDYAKVLKEASNGLNRVTGHKNVGMSLLTLDVSTPGKLAAAVKANGILDGIDLAKLMELIEFIVKLFKLFAPM